MKRFVFSLEKLLHFRIFKEKQAEILLGKKTAECERIDIALKALAEKYKNSLYDLQPEKGNLHSASYFIDAQNYLTALNTKKEQLLTERVHAEMEREEARQVYIAAHREKEIISKLKEKKHREWKKLQQREEDNNLDDFVNTKYNVEE
ncbi:flagellar export protein FliJ [Treponema phagedenis]|uniref:flagellar export protein FliJ n=1 Tax=Treponema phagedenis TaxID=162 RepID=UPI0001F64235|nr:flagellar export protein FliJ [Treponema phagedenis]EFW39289.1 flagellar export protein FliJ [Treponema phagedenis F0421]TYT79504.1 flagellar export protein FliJ [Treponema phagedenis]